MTNKEYKDKYGEEAYELYLRKKKELAREYYKKNKEKIAERSIEHYKENRESRIARMKEYNQANKEVIRAYKKEYYQKNSEQVKESSLEYYKERSKTKEGRASSLLGSYRCSEKRHNRGECTLTRGWIIENILNSACVYCGETDWTKLGCDRIDNSLPHTPENCVCSCKDCNDTRFYKKMSVEEFKNYMKNVRSK